jgi:hypothetical protein
MDKDYNKILAESINLWIDRAEDEFEKRLRKSLSYTLIQDIFYQIDVFLNAEFYSEIFYRKKNIFEKGIKHFFFYFMWTIKWTLYKWRLKSKKIIVTQLLPDTVSTRRYLKDLTSYQNQFDCILINIGMIYSFKKIFTQSFLCFPTKLYGYKLFDKKKHNSAQLTKDLNVLENILKNYFPDIKLKINDYEFIYLANIKMYLGAKYFLESNKTKIKFLIQDIDYLAERVLINYLFSSNDIKTICIDHSLRIYDHLHNDYPSDIYLLWGEYNKSKLMKGNAISKKECHLIGLSGNRFSNIQTNNGKYWIYFLQAYGNPHSPTFNRTLAYTYKILQSIITVVREISEVDLIIKSHPSDEYIFKNLFPDNYISAVDKQILEKTKLLFVEDSTISAELLNTNIPIIYIEDSVNSNPMDLTGFNIVHSYNLNKNLKDIVSMALADKVNSSERKLSHKFYFDEPISISHTLKKIFE